MSRERAFSGRTAGILAGIAAASLAASFVLGIFSDVVSEQRSAGSDGFSRSAVGHRAFVELVEALGAPVLQSQHDTASRVGGAALFVIEPRLNDDSDVDEHAELRAMIENSLSTLVVLPKWSTMQDPFEPDHVNAAVVYAADTPAAVLSAVGITGTIVRPSAASAWTAGGDAWRAEPTIGAPQLVVSDMLTPLIATDEGVLFGVYELWEGQFIYVLSDPDLLANHGLGRGENALVAAAIIDEVLRDTSGSAVIDETLHGFRRPPSLWRALFEFPLALATVQVLLAVALLVWAAAARFGKPAPAQPPFAPGKEFLIDNIAALSRFGGHTDLTLDRYLEVAIQETARALHAPARLRGADLHRWLDGVASARNLDVDVAGLHQAVRDARNKPTAAVAAATRIYEWRQELTHGSRVHPGHR